MFFKKSIKKEVMKAFGQRIKVAQKDYDLSCKELEAQKKARQKEILAKFEAELSTLCDSHESSKCQLLESVVTRVLTK